MSLLFADGFDQYAAAADMDDKYNTSGSSATLLTTGGRFGTRCLDNTIDNNQDIITLAAGHDVITFGGAYSQEVNNNDADNMMYFYGNSGANLHCLIQMRHDGSILVQGAGVTVGYTRCGVLTTGLTVGLIFDWVECRVFVHDTVGTIELRVNGVVEFTFTGDTNAGGDGNINQLWWSGTNSRFRWCDRFIYNAEGPTDGNALDDFMGEIKIVSLQPEGPPTADEDWENGIDTDENWTQVDGLTVDDNTTYVQEEVDSAGGGRRDRYEFEDLDVVESNLSLDAIIHSVNLCMYALKDDALSEAFVNMIVESQGSEDISGPKTMATTYDFHLHPVDTDPLDGSQWSIARVNAITAGQEIS